MTDIISHFSHKTNASLKARGNAFKLVCFTLEIYNKENDFS